MSEAATLPLLPSLDVAAPEKRDELELKLLAPTGALESLRASPVIARRARNGGESRRLDTVYYDTPDCSLYRHGLSLRVRQSATGYVQTLKRGPVIGRPFNREEWETPISGAVPDLGLLPQSEIGPPLEGLDPGSLDPVFVTKIDRREQRLEQLGSVVEIAFDEGSIEAGEHSEPLAEIELEMKAGDPRVLYDLGIELLDIAPLRISTRSKAERGYGLAFQMEPKVTKATAPAISVEHKVDDIIGVLLGNCQHQLIANQPLAERGQDPEGAHQMRVALRRMRTACALLGKELGLPSLRAFSDDAGWVAKMLGGARDWDVFICDTLTGVIRDLPPGIVDFEALREAAAPRRAAAYSVLWDILASKRYNRFLLSLRNWIECRGWRSEVDTGSLPILLEPASVFADRVLTRLHGRALKRGQHFHRLPADRRHRLRVSLKKLRYAGEFFHNLCLENAEAKPFFGSLTKLQDALGQHNDASMTYPLLCDLDRNTVSPELHRAVGAVIGWQARDHAEVERTLRKYWRQFKSTPVFWGKPAQ
jgi:inorganic triphosphatase YgiF